MSRYFEPDTKVSAVVQHPSHCGTVIEVQGRVMYDEDPDSILDVVGVLVYRVRPRSIWGLVVDVPFEAPEGDTSGVIWIPREDVYCLPERVGDVW